MEELYMNNEYDIESRLEPGICLPAWNEGIGSRTGAGDAPRNASSTYMNQIGGAPRSEEEERIRVWDQEMALAGRRVGDRYEIQGIVGVGGSCVVYRARDLSDGRIYALKMLRQDRAGDLHAVRQLRIERRVVGALSHENIVKLYEDGEYEGRYFLVLQFVNGNDLGHILKERGPLAPREAVRISLDLLCALDYLHTCGFVHSNVTPFNLLIDRESGHVYLCDFGASAHYPGEGTGQRGARSGYLLCTPEYMSPEQARGEEVGPPSDRYQAFAVLYTMLTGRTLFPEAYGDPVTLASKHAFSVPITPGEIYPAIPARLSTAVMKGIDPDQGKRYGSAEDAQRELQVMLRGNLMDGVLSKLADVAGRVQRLPTPNGTRIERSERVKGERPESDRNREISHGTRDVDEWESAGAALSTHERDPFETGPLWEFPEFQLEERPGARERSSDEAGRGTHNAESGAGRAPKAVIVVPHTEPRKDSTRESPTENEEWDQPDALVPTKRDPGERTEGMGVKTTNGSEPAGGIPAQPYDMGNVPYAARKGVAGPLLADSPPRRGSQPYPAYLYGETIIPEISIRPPVDMLDFGVVDPVWARMPQWMREAKLSITSNTGETVYVVCSTTWLDVSPREIAPGTRALLVRIKPEHLPASGKTYHAAIELRTESGSTRTFVHVYVTPRTGVQLAIVLDTRNADARLEETAKLASETVRELQRITPEVGEQLEVACMMFADRDHRRSLERTQDPVEWTGEWFITPDQALKRLDKVTPANGPYFVLEGALEEALPRLNALNWREDAWHGVLVIANHAPHPLNPNPLFQIRSRAKTGRDVREKEWNEEYDALVDAWELKSICVTHDIYWPRTTDPATNTQTPLPKHYHLAQEYASGAWASIGKHGWYDLDDLHGTELHGADIVSLLTQACMDSTAVIYGGPHPQVG
ncbi:MAG TPA: serine/threonine-protein kinase [Chloroflexia bacterium]|nr:serine/threonine-protein kinase [Chloroflexia bacterium]